jgi:DTW domain-containing protein YfiP
MKETPVPHRQLCLRCRRPKRVCWCDAVVPIESRTHVVFVQHPREAKVPISTCRMAHLSLPNSELHVELKAEGNARLEALCKEPSTALLFPSDEATDVRDLRERPKTLFVIDGTWSCAKKVVERSPLLASLPRLSLTPEKPGAYRIRKEPAEHCLATIEAAAYVLEALEDAPGRFRGILKAFDTMVERQLDFIASKAGPSRHRFKRARNSPKSDPLAELRAAAERLVLVFGEANAWAQSDANRPASGEAELIQLVAARPSSNDRFASLLKPKDLLAPGVSAHLEVATSEFLSAPSRHEALHRFRAFLRPGDVLVGWGTYCRDLLASEGVEENSFVNLRSCIARIRSGRPGSVEALAAELGFGTASMEGRALRRLAALEFLTRAALQGKLQPLNAC